MSPIAATHGRWSTRAVALACACACALVACAQLIGLSSLEEGPYPPDGATDGASDAGDSGDGDGGEAGVAEPCANGEQDGDETDIDCGGSKCGKCPKGKKCKVDADCAKTCDTDAGVCVGCEGTTIEGSACIDPNEVTVGEYDVFRTKGPTEFGRMDRCTGRVSHPRDFQAQLGKNKGLPVRNVVWCSAWAFCKYRGKHLCGKLDGTPAAPADFGNAAVDQWMAACTGVDRRIYPYGNSFEPARCNDQSPMGEPWEAGSALDCKTLTLDLYDMSGNVAEWEDACEDAGRDGGAGGCRVRGGSFKSTANAVACGSDALRDPAIDNDDIGIRCCE